MGATTGFPSIVLLYIFLNYFTMDATYFSTNFYIPAFADICMNMMFVDNFTNESVSYFESCPLIKNYLPDFYVFPSKYITNRSIPAPSFSLFALLSAFLKTSPPLYYGKISITLLISCMNLIPSRKISSYSSLLIDVTNSSSFTISTSGVYISDSASVSLSGSLL